jgi:type IV secretion system protein TrbB
MTDLSPRAELQRRLVETIRYQLGEVICRLLDDPQVIEIMLNSDGRLWVDRLGEGMTSVGSMQSTAAESVISIVASTLRTSITHDNPILECELPIRGARFEALIPPVVPAPTFALRMKAVRVFSLENYVTANIMTARQRDVIEDAVDRRWNILVAGGTGVGKTTLGNAVLAEIAARAFNDRLVVLEDTLELQCAAQNFVSLRTSETVDMQRLLKATMRLRPDRIIVGEVRDGAALAMLKAWNTGHPGSLCTIHANSAASALTRLEHLIAEATSAPMRSVIAEAINLIVPLVKTKTSRVVNPIVRVEGLHAGEYVLTELEA